MPSDPQPALASTRAWSRPRLIVWLVLIGAGLALAGWGYLALHDRQERQRGLHLARDDRFDEAKPLLLAAIARDPQDIPVLKALGRGYLATVTPNDARPFLERWSELRPSDTEALQLRLDLYSKQQDFEAAVAVARRLSELQPDDFTAQRKVAQLAFSSGDFEGCEATCRTCLETTPNDRRTQILLVEALRARGRTDEAGAILDRILATDPDDAGTLMFRGIILRETGHPEQAVPLLQRVVQIDPSRKRSARYELAQALEQAGRPDEARKVMAEVRAMQDAEVLGIASRSQPDNLELQVRAAAALLANGNTREGLDMLNAVLKRDPSFQPAHRLLADYYEQHGEAERAATHRSKILAK
jgi:tetratricopeptide (TPR) repeat protein